VQDVPGQGVHADAEASFGSGGFIADRPDPEADQQPDEDDPDQDEHVPPEQRRVRIEADFGEARVGETVSDDAGAHPRVEPI
jgi:hypothetical protein